jgi:hypothetical protein
MKTDDEQFQGNDNRRVNVTSVIIFALNFEHITGYTWYCFRWYLCCRWKQKEHRTFGIPKPFTWLQDFGYHCDVKMKPKILRVLGFHFRISFIYSIIMTGIGIQITFVMIRAFRMIFPEKDLLVRNLPLGRSESVKEKSHSNSQWNTCGIITTDF